MSAGPRLVAQMTPQAWAFPGLRFWLMIGDFFGAGYYVWEGDNLAFSASDSPAAPARLLLIDTAGVRPHKETSRMALFLTNS